jgi:hypothetical protein
MTTISLKQLTLGLTLGAMSLPIFAVPTSYDGITFPDGDVSFADFVIRYDNAYGGGTIPTDPNFLDPDAALGPPDYPDPSAPGTGSVSLGSGGLIQLLFWNNSLTNSGDTDDDLHVFEIGPDVEDTFVAIRPTVDTRSLLIGSYGGREINDGFFDVGKVFGSTESIDIDSIFSGFGAGQLRFDAVQLIDDIDEGASRGSTVGADIDAVGAIFSAPPVNQVPEPGSLALLAGGLLLGSVTRLFKRSQ